MKKNFYSFLAVAAILLLAVVVGIKANSEGETELDLLTQNVEALTEDESDEKNNGCETKERYYSPIIINGEKDGFWGTIYKCKKGNLSFCKEGMSGTKYNAPFRGMSTSINDVIVRKCK